VKLQLLSDLHLDTETFDPEPTPGAELLVLAGDIDSALNGWQGYQRFKGWPVPVLVVAGNHEFDGQDFDDASRRLRSLCEQLGFVLLERQAHLHTAADGSRVHFVGSTRWSDFDLFGAAERERCLRAGAYFQKVMKARRGGRDFDAAAVREEGLLCRAWLEHTLALPTDPAECRVVVTHFAPSLRSADPRYGRQPGTASFCNADDDLIPRADLWLHGHLHCRFDYRVERAGQRAGRVVCQARGLAKKNEHLGFEPGKLIEV
jgi:hypothetical protein